MTTTEFVDAGHVTASAYGGYLVDVVADGFMPVVRAASSLANARRAARDAAATVGFDPASVRLVQRDPYTFTIRARASWLGARAAS